MLAQQTHTHTSRMLLTSQCIEDQVTRAVMELRYDALLERKTANWNYVQQQHWLWALLGWDKHDNTANFTYYDTGTSDGITFIPSSS